MPSDSGGRAFGALRLVSPSAKDGGGAASPARLDDQALLAAVRAGEPRVAADLCNRLWPQVERTVRRLLGHWDSDREDMAQVSFMEIVNTIDRYRGDCSLDRWAQTVTAHVVFKHLRRRKLERRLFSELVADDIHAGPMQVEHMSVSRQLLSRVADHLEDMNPDRVWAFLLHDVLGYDLPEVAEMTGASVAATQSRLSRGRRELHRRIDQEPDLVHLLHKVAREDRGSEAVASRPRAEESEE